LRPQIYEEAESNANKFAIAEAQQYMWTFMAKYTKKPRAMQTSLLKLHRSAAGPHTIKIRTNGKKV